MTTATATREIKVYGYRWVVLVTYILISIMIQILWICYAPITKAAAAGLGVTDGAIGLLAMIWMFVFIPLSIPASWAIDTWGFKKAVSLGAVLMAVFAMLRGLFAMDYTWTLIATIGLAIAQPLFLNSGTKMAANWFRLEERATIIGVGGLFTILGIALGQILTPILVEASGMSATMLIYGIAAVVTTLLFLILGRDHPPTPAGHEEKALVLTGSSASSACATSTCWPSCSLSSTRSSTASPRGWRSWCARAAWISARPG